MAEFGDVAHCVPAQAHVDPVADLNDAELLRNRKEVHVGSFWWHDGVDFSPGHDVVRDLQSESIRCWPLLEGRSAWFRQTKLG